MTTLSIGKFRKIMKEIKKPLINKHNAKNCIEDQISYFESLLDNKNNNPITKLGDRMLAQMATLYLIKTYNDLPDNEKKIFNMYQHYPDIAADDAETILTGLNESDDNNKIGGDPFDDFYKKLNASNQLDASKELKNFIKSTSKDNKEFPKNFNKALDNYIDGFAKQSRIDLKSPEKITQQNRYKLRLKTVDANTLLQQYQIIGLQQNIENLNIDINNYSSMINQIKRNQNDRNEQITNFGIDFTQKHQPIDENQIKNENALINQLQDKISANKNSIATLELQKKEIENKAIIKSEPIIETSIIPIKNQEIVKKDQNKDEDELLAYQPSDIKPKLIIDQSESELSASQRSESPINKQTGEKSTEIFHSIITIPNSNVLKKQKSQNKSEVKRNKTQKSCFLR